MKGIMINLLFSCKKATELIEKKTVFGLSWEDSLRLKMHLTICSACTDYKNKSKIIEKILAQINARSIQYTTLSEEIKLKIIAQVEKN